MTTDKMIKEMANEFREQMKHSYLCGKPIDMSNPDHLIVAAYHIGEAIERKHHQVTLDSISQVTLDIISHLTRS